MNENDIEDKRIDVIFDVKTRPSLSPSFSFFSDNKGIKAAENVPSAKNRRKRLGNLKAIKKASAIGPEPKKTANNISRAKPNILLIRVQILTTALDLYISANFFNDIILQMNNFLYFLDKYALYLLRDHLIST